MLDAASPMMTEPVPDSKSDSDMSDIVPPPKTRKLEGAASYRMKFRLEWKKSSTLLRMFTEILRGKKFIGLFL